MNSKLKIFALMGIFAALSDNNSYSVRCPFENKSVEDIIKERRDKRLKSSYVERSVKDYMGKKKASRKKRKKSKI